MADTRSAAADQTTPDDRIGAPVFAFLRTIVMNLLRRAGYRSIRQGLRELAYDIKGMLALGEVAAPARTTESHV